ncbi:hypothetical protein [Listeria newyorkensis]|uniref:hypothetical protein n=1 Tax=Listeria newyorkensis TaxID=1497681 RepID=UPI00051DF8AE|nr:hypothetical protein [Listeria newyorkensis]KGL44137.1 hypothetical protein EP58_06730 [Listeria newyorkensis]SQC57717.1 Uncharacterised protein [Listeria newyorkensis]
MSTKKQWVTQLTGLLMAIYSLLMTLNLHFDWLTVESINAAVTVIVAAVVFGGTLYAVFKNTFLFKNGKRQAELIEKGKLYECGETEATENGEDDK